MFLKLLIGIFFRISSKEVKFLAKFGEWIQPLNYRIGAFCPVLYENLNRSMNTQLH